MKIKTGDEAPQFTLVDQDGEEWSLAAHRGSPVVVYFFPKADTPGCTTQACDIRDHWADFGDLGVEVVGISPDQQDKMAKFAGKYDLPHRLLGDPQRQAIEDYGAWGEKKMYGKAREGVLRSSVVIDADGRVAAVFDAIKPKEQSEKALGAVKALAG